LLFTNCNRCGPDYRNYSYFRFVRQRKTFRHWLHYVRNRKNSISDDNSDTELVTRAKDYCKSPVQPKTSASLFEFSQDHSNTSPKTNSNVGNLEPQIEVSCQLPCKEQMPLADPKIRKDVHHSPNHSTSSAAHVLPVLTTSASTLVPDVFYVSSVKSSRSEQKTSENVSTQLKLEQTPYLPVTSKVNESKTNVVLVVTEISIPESKENIHIKDQSKPVLIEKSQTPPSPEASDNDLNPLSELSPPISKKIKTASPSPNSDDYNLSDADIPLAQLSAELLRRPKRVNAASRYKAIMTQLSPSLTTNEPIKKRLRTFQKSHSFEERNLQPTPPQRRSLRLSMREIEANKKKAVSERKTSKYKERKSIKKQK